MSADDNLVKVAIPLKGSAKESGFETESVWAEHIGADRYMIWNVPVFAYNIEMRAIVQCRPDPDGGLPIVTKVLSQGDCFGVRVYFDPHRSDEDVQRVLDLFNSKNALSEKYNRNLRALAYVLGRITNGSGRRYSRSSILESSTSSRTTNPTNARTTAASKIRVPPSAPRPLRTVTNLP